MWLHRRSFGFNLRVTIGIFSILFRSASAAIVELPTAADKISDWRETYHGVSLFEALIPHFIIKKSDDSYQIVAKPDWRKNCVLRFKLPVIWHRERDETSFSRPQNFSIGYAERRCDRNIFPKYWKRCCRERVVLLVLWLYIQTWLSILEIL